MRGSKKVKPKYQYNYLVVDVRKHYNDKVLSVRDYIVKKGTQCEGLNIQYNGKTVLIVDKESCTNALEHCKNKPIKSKFNATTYRLVDFRFDDEFTNENQQELL